MSAYLEFCRYRRAASKGEVLIYHDSIEFSQAHCWEVVKLLRVQAALSTFDGWSRRTSVSQLTPPTDLAPSPGSKAQSAQSSLSPVFRPSSAVLSLKPPKTCCLTMHAEQPSRPPNADPSTAHKILAWDKLFESEAPPRLGMEVGYRLPLTAMSAFSAGSAIGVINGSKKAAYRFRAENAHRFPTTSTGWFQYHKNKNYTTIVGGVKEGSKMGSKLAAGALAFSLFEETVDYARHDRRDFLSTVTAGLSFSGIYSLLGTSCRVFF